MALIIFEDSKLLQLFWLYWVDLVAGVQCLYIICYMVKCDATPK